MVDPARRQFDFMNEQIKEAQATADRRLKLLERFPEFVWDDEQGAYFCPICGANSNHGHLTDCELAKELADNEEV